jgi:hypothetical protein
MFRKALLPCFLVAVLTPAVGGAQHELAGLQIRDLKLDAGNGRMSFELVNTTDKWITGWAWRIEQANLADGAGVRWFDNYPEVDIPGMTSMPSATGGRIRPGEVRQIVDPVPDNATGISLVAVVFEDTTAVGEAWILDRLEKQRQTDVAVHAAVLAELTRIRASTNAADVLQKSIDRILPASPNTNRRDLLVRSRLERVQKALKPGYAPAPVIAFHETITQAQLERAKAQAHLKRMQ